MGDVTERGLRRPNSGQICTAVSLLVLGIALVALLLTKVVRDGGETLYQLARLGLVIPVLVLTAASALYVLGVCPRLFNPRSLLLGTVLAGAVGNLVVPFVALGSRAWGAMIALEQPLGIDFRAGLYQPAAAFSAETSSWPPLNLIVGAPFTLLNEDLAYRVQVFALVILALLAVLMIADVGRRAVEAHSATTTVLAVVLGLWLLTSYGFLFEVERGNLDLYALFFSLLAVWLMVRNPKALWWPAFFLAVAINLKVYPGILLVLLFWRHRWKAIIPVVVLNAALLLAAGPSNAWQFIHNSLQMQGSPSLWVGNHSAQSFANSLRYVAPWLPETPWYLFLAVPLLLWVATLVVVVKQGWSRRSAVLLAAASIPLMNIAPPVSHDYKLVLLVFPVGVLGMLLIQPASGRLGSRAWRGSLLFVTGLIMALISVSTLFWANPERYIVHGLGNKYPLMVLVQVLFLVVAVLLREEPVPEANAPTL